MSWIVLDDAKREVGPFVGAGRALLLCQHFESACKNIVMWFSLADAVHRERFKLSTDEHMNFVDKLLTLQLARSVDRFPSLLPESSEAEMATLIAAKDSRNFICHESLQGLAYSWRATPDAHCWDTEDNRKHVRAIADGDYVVSLWSYEFHEKQSGAFKQRERYVSQLVAWVFSDADLIGDVR